MNETDYRAAFEPIAGLLCQIPHLAWADLVGWIPLGDRGDMFPIPRAGLLQWRMIVHAQNIFGTNGPTRMVKDEDGLHFLVFENGDTHFGVEFGKACDVGLRRHKNVNSKNSAMLGQSSFWFFDGEPKRFNLVYTIDGAGISAQIGKIAITLETDHGVEWRMVLDEGSIGGDDLGIPMHPTEPPTGPASPQIIPTPLPPSGDGEEELPAAASGA